MKRKNKVPKYQKESNATEKYGHGGYMKKVMKDQMQGLGIQGFSPKSNFNVCKKR